MFFNNQKKIVKGKADAEFRVGLNKYMIPAAVYVLLNKFWV